MVEFKALLYDIHFNEKTMKHAETRLEQAKSIHAAGMGRVANEPEPDGQLFPCGSRVRIADDLGEFMSHFESGKNATVKYTYAHAFGGGNVKSYCLDIDGVGQVSWYYEYQLTAIQ